MEEAQIEVASAGLDRCAALAGVFGRAFVNEPMMRWPLGTQGDPVDRFTHSFACFLREVLPKKIVWEAGAAMGAAVWVPPDAEETWEVHPWNQPEIGALTNDEGQRYTEFWDWVYSHTPAEPLWQLDSIAVEPEAQGRGIGKAMIAVGLEAARADGVSAFLSTGTPRNVSIYERSGFHVVEKAQAPNGGPAIWFMHWDPS